MNPLPESLRLAVGTRVLPACERPADSLGCHGSEPRGSALALVLKSPVIVTAREKQLQTESEQECQSRLEGTAPRTTQFIVSPTYRARRQLHATRVWVSHRLAEKSTKSQARNGSFFAGLSSPAPLAARAPASPLGAGRSVGIL